MSKNYTGNITVEELLGMSFEEMVAIANGPTNQFSGSEEGNKAKSVSMKAYWVKRKEKEAKYGRKKASN